MQKLNDLEISGIFLDIISANKDEYDDFYITVRITNLSDKSIHTTLSGSRYISNRKGILNLERTKPTELEYSSMGCDILPNSFLDAGIRYEIDEISDGDRIELYLSNIGYFLILRKKREWYVIEYYEKPKIEKHLNNIIEQFEAIEEKIGICIQNISIKIADNNSIELFCEVLSANGEPPTSSFAIEVAIYNKSNKIIDFKSIRKGKDDFIGFEVFSFGSFTLNLDEIGKIRFYPTKI